MMDISQATRRTGLTARALRFYEARGLVRPLRSHSGRRYYGPAELERIGQILALKRAGLSLAQIQRMTARRPIDLAALVEAQLALVEERARELQEARALLLSVKSRIDRGEPIDAETFCSLIRQGDEIMEEQQWKRALERHYSAEELAHWAENPPPADFDQAEYGRRWQELGSRIDASLPLDPAGAEAQALLDEWDALLEPFRAVATPQMMAGTSSFWERAEEHRREVAMPFSPEAFRFIQEARAARMMVAEKSG